MYYQQNETPRKKDNKQKEEVWKRNKKPRTDTRKRYELLPEIRPKFTEKGSPMETFEKVTSFDEFIKMIVTRSNL